MLKRFVIVLRYIKPNGEKVQSAFPTIVVNGVMQPVLENRRI